MSIGRVVETVAGVDVGTSGVKAVLVDRKGTVLNTSTQVHPLSMPRPGWAEQDPRDWWVGVTRCLEALGLDPNTDADRVGLSGQMHGAVCLDAAGAVVRPAIIWNDQRTLRQLVGIGKRVGIRKYRQITGSPPLTGLQLPKLLWIREEEPASYQRVHSVLLPKDYVRYRLTGEQWTEPSDASGTGMFDIRRARWSQDVINALKVDASLLPAVQHSVAVRGAGDQAAAAVGAGAVLDGVLNVRLGTRGVVFAALEALPADRHDAVQLGCHANGKWSATTVMLSCGGAFRWLRDLFESDASYDALTEAAGAVEAGCEGLTFLPYLTGERTPYNDPLATGAFAGLTLRHRRGHLVRAVLEGVTFGLADGLAALVKLTKVAPREVRLTGGGAKSALWRQIVADVFGAPTVTLACDEGPAYGAAILAGVAAGWWSSVEEACDAVVRVCQRTEPSGVDYWEAYARYRALYPVLKRWA